MLGLRISSSIPFVTNFSISKKRPLWIPRAALALSIGLISIACAQPNEHGLDQKNFDHKINPCMDFWQYANGGWLQVNPIPAEYSRWSLDDELNERNLSLLKNILEDAAKNPGEHGSNQQKIGDFYATAIDQSAADRAGYAPIQTDLAKIDTLSSKIELTTMIRDWQSHGLNVLFEFGVAADLKNSSTAIAYAQQGGLGLPDRDYYLRDDAKSKKLRLKYVTHIEHMLDLIGAEHAKQQAQWILALETRLAHASLDRVALREPLNSYHMYTLQEADKKTPNFSWTAFFAALDRPDVHHFSLAQPEFFTVADQALVDIPLVQWQAYLRWHLLNFAAPYLSQAFVNEDFDFYSQTLRGTKQLKPRWKRAVDATNHALGEAVGEIYVQRTFPAAAKQRALDMVNNLKTTLRIRLEKLDWMSAETKQAALAKLDTLKSKIGYPDLWRDYTKLEIKRDTYLANMRAATTFEAQRQFAKIDRPVDKNEWDMTPQTVNAYYSSMQNEIVFPAAQLQPPYFDPNADDALNYGGIGSVIGHEMLHGFDDEGSQFDANGNLLDWWSQKDREQFQSRTEKLVQQFNSYIAIDDLPINGKLTLGENIADLGGLLVAYDAFQLAVKGKPDTKIDGLTANQRFFLSFAQAWRTSQRPEQLKLQVQSNEHAPAKYRVIGPISNMPTFAAAFQCPANSSMTRADKDRTMIW